jgi:hypothetical protein
LAKAGSRSVVGRTCDERVVEAPLLAWLQRIKFRFQVAISHKSRFARLHGRPHQVVLFTGVGDV